MKKLYIICAVIVAVVGSTLSASAQYYQTSHVEDLQMHSGFQVSGKVADRWGVVWGEELYFGNNISQFQKLYSRVMVHYYLKPNLTLSPLVMHIVNTPSKTHTLVHDMNIIYTHRIDRLAITLRAGTRLQDNLSAVAVDGVVKANPDFSARAHIGAAYRLCEHFEPYANIETFLMLTPATCKMMPDGTDLNPSVYTTGLYPSRLRSNVGVKCHINRHHIISLYWRYDHTQSKHLNLSIVGKEHYGIITAKRTNNFVGVFYDYKF